MKSSIFGDVAPVVRWKWTDVSEEQSQSSADYLLHDDYLAYSSGLKIDLACSSETSADFQRTNRCHIEEVRTLHIRVWEPQNLQRLNTAEEIFATTQLGTTQRSVYQKASLFPFVLSKKCQKMFEISYDQFASHSFPVY
jgi:hypothetical protein